MWIECGEDLLNLEKVVWIEKGKDFYWLDSTSKFTYWKLSFRSEEGGDYVRVFDSEQEMQKVYSDIKAKLIPHLSPACLRIKC